MTTSTLLRNTLTRWEKAHSLRIIRHLPKDDCVTNVISFKRRKDSTIMRVPIRIEKAIFVLPTLIWWDGIDEWVADYVRHLIVKDKWKTSSVEETVKVLRMYRRFQRAHRVPHAQVNDDFLLAWQNLKKAQKTSIRRCNYCISVVHDFYKWADASGRLSHHVQTRSMHDYDHLPDGYVFPISGKQIDIRLPNGQVYVKWVSGLLDTGVHSSYGSRRTPTPKQVVRLLNEAKKKGRNSARNLLMLVVALETGARVSEIIQLKVGQFPSPDNLGRYIGKDPDPYLEVEVERKNQGKGRLRINNALVLKIVAFIYGDNQRLTILRTKQQGNQSADHCVFLSENGKGITADSVTRIAGELFESAGIDRANIHRLRARYITNVIEVLLDRIAEQGVTVNRSEAWEQQILVMAVELMGHSHPMSLQPYLNEILQRRLTKDNRISTRTEEEIDSAFAEMTEQLASQIFEVSELARANQLMLAGQREEAIELLSGFVEKIRAVEVA
ncbi:tyrosine-type recombinase/integrase [Rhizobium ruizarguesonis]|uniref:tyrosine-type recombinase/integrase n=1 Tax=Rhizobium ruizarguesonis TaxID=2081791 RepID=UPI0013EF45E1|nr:site-specific integrase [Rhizobium ruizarguesonis]